MTLVSPVSDLASQMCPPTLPVTQPCMCALFQVSTVIACVLRDAGAPTAPCPATAKTGLRAPLTMASVSVHQGSEVPLVREVSASLGSSFYLFFSGYHVQNYDVCPTSQFIVKLCCGQGQRRVS